MQSKSPSDGFNTSPAVQELLLQLRLIAAKQSLGRGQRGRSRQDRQSSTLQQEIGVQLTGTWKLRLTRNMQLYCADARLVSRKVNPKKEETYYNTPQTVTFQSVDA